MGTTYKFQAHSVTDQHTPEPTINYHTSESGVSQYKSVDGKESMQTSGVTRVSSRSKDAPVYIGGMAVNPAEAEAFIEELEGEKEELEAKAEQEAEEQEKTPSESFDQSTNILLDDMDQGSLSNAINLAINGQLDDDNLAESVRSLGFSDRDSALEVARNITGALNEKFDRIAQEEGLRNSNDAWTMLTSWNNRAEASKALGDWMSGRGVDSSRLREAMRESFNAYGRADNPILVENLKADGYEVRASSGGGIVLKGNGLDDWTTWAEARESFREW